MKSFWHIVERLLKSKFFFLFHVVIAKKNKLQCSKGIKTNTILLDKTTTLFQLLQLWISCFFVTYLTNTWKLSYIYEVEKEKRIISNLNRNFESVTVLLKFHFLPYL